MKKTAERLKELAICAAIALLALLPATIHAQNDSFFYSNFGENIENRDAEIVFGLINDPFGEASTPFGFGASQGTQLPLDSGLLIMLAAGAGYAVARRKRSCKNAPRMSNGMMLLMASVLMLGTTQCKKRIETVTHGSDNTIQITLRTGYDSRYYIDLDQQLGYSPMHFSSGDIIYVGDGTTCIGQLTYGSSGFTGGITTPSGSDLYFYFVGNLTPTWNSDNSAFTIDIHDQWNNSAPNNNTHKLPVLSCGKDEYWPDKTDFSCILSNQCVLVRFELSSGDNDTYRISNMLSEAKVDFTNNLTPEIVPTGVLDAITLYCGNHYVNNLLQPDYKYRWAILLRTPEERHTYAIKGYDEDFRTYYNMDNIGPFIPGPSANNYIYDQYIINNTANDVTDDNLFIVSNNGNVVELAPGNLQYQASSGIWRFAEHPWDYVGNASNGTVYVNGVKCNNALVSQNYEGWIDLFGWGCTGEQDLEYNMNQHYYQPYNNEYGSIADINSQYGPTGTHLLSVENKSDWGSVNISNSNETGWRSLTYKEWYKMRYASSTYQGQITDENGNKINGVIILPAKIWDGGAFTPANNSPNAWNYYQFTAQDWMDNYAAHGAVFMPNSYQRQGSTLKASGLYWIASSHSDWKADYLSISAIQKLNPNQTGSIRSLGCMVRLAR